MRTYFERLENCRHRRSERFWSKLGRNPSRHGWGGWLPTERAIPHDGAQATTTCARRSSQSAQGRAGVGRRPARRPCAARKPATIPTTGASSRAERHRRALRAADDGQPRAGGHARAAARQSQSRYPGSAEDRARRARHARAVRRRQPGDRRRVPEGRAAVRRAREAQRGRRRRAPGARVARSHPGRRRVQHAAAADAVGHRPARGARSPEDSGARRCSRASAGTCRIATKSPSSTGCPSRRGRRCGAPRSRRTIRSSRSGRRTGAASTRPTASCCRSSSASTNEQPEPDLFCYGLIGRFEGYFPGYSTLVREEPELPDVGRPQGAHEQHGGHRHAAHPPTRAMRRP